MDGKHVGNEDSTVKNETGEELAYWLSTRQPDLRGKELGVRSVELNSIGGGRRVDATGSPSPYDAVWLGGEGSGLQCTPNTDILKHRLGSEATMDVGNLGLPREAHANRSVVALAARN